MGINVLSLFDGISCGRVALERAGIKVDQYYASEIDKQAIKISKDNYKDIIHIGDVNKTSYKDNTLHTEFGVFTNIKIDLILAGSPCQGFSFAGKQSAFDDPRSSLYFEFERILKEVNPRYFLLENVKMKKEYKDVISERLGVNPNLINSRLVSAQNRPRLYWTNIDFDMNIQDKFIYLVDVLLDDVDDKYFIKAGRLSWLKKFGEVKERDGYIAFNPNKAKCLTEYQRYYPSWNTTYILQWPRGANPGGLRGIDGKTPSLTKSSWPANNLLLKEGMVRKLTPVECERLQTLPDNYTKAVADTHRYSALGNGWTVDIIAHILGGLPPKLYSPLCV